MVWIKGTIWGCWECQLYIGELCGMLHYKSRCSQVVIRGWLSMFVNGYGVADYEGHCECLK